MKRVAFFLVLLTNSFLLYAQSVAINTDQSTPNPSAMLDVKSNNKGLLIPRTSTTSRLAITNPAKGLMLYDTTAGSFWFYNGAAWNALSSGSATNYWTANGANIYNNNTGNIGIGINTALAPLHIKKDNEVLRIEGTSPYLSFYNTAGTVPRVFMQNTEDNLYLGTSTGNSTGITQFYSNNTPLMTMAASGNVGIGTDAPVSKLDVKTPNNTNGISHTGDGGNILATRMGGTSAGIGTFSNTNMRIFANGNSAMFINASDGYVGVGVDFPANNFQIGSVGNTGYFNYPFVIGSGDGTNVMSIYNNFLGTVIQSNNNILLSPATENVGINTSSPSNKLQIGSVGNTGFATNDLAIGNGTNAMAIYQTNDATLIGSTTDIILRPRNNGAGRVGINTNNPRAPLEVSGNNSLTQNFNSQFSYLNVSTTNYGLFIPANYPIPDISIIATGRVYASEFNAYSDARIKTINGISNSTKDLATINALQITDYTFKDKIKSGDKTYKKVIAQQVEKFYPQVVSKHTDFIPNVYQVTAKVAKEDEGLLLTFTLKHNITKAAKKLRVLTLEEAGMNEYEIVAIPNDNQVVIKADGLKSSKIFVYGEEVDDFRTVDYEGLTTLNISATQELSKLIEVQNKKIEALEMAIKKLTEKQLTAVRSNQ